jgi:hypothetical protein
MDETMQNESLGLQDSAGYRQGGLKDYAPVGHRIGCIEYLELLLKKPGALFYEMNATPKVRSFIVLFVFSTLMLVMYGLVVGSFSGGRQYMVAPAKTIIGMYASALICLPSLYIFACLGRAKTGFISLMGNLLIVVTLIGVLLIGFIPVAWIFSQSTTAIPFMGFIHITVFLISLVFAFRLLGQALLTVSGQKSPFTAIWMMIFTVVALQMSTSLRPIIGVSDRFLQSDKKFFLSHWAETVTGSNTDRK